MNLKTLIFSLVAVVAMATPAFAGTKSVKSTDNNVSSDTEQVANMT